MNNLIARITLPWNASRILFLALGIIMLTQAIIDQLWFGILIGGYFTATGLFAWGCAGGNCAIPVEKTEIKE